MLAGIVGGLNTDFFKEFGTFLLAVGIFFVVSITLMVWRSHHLH